MPRLAPIVLLAALFTSSAAAQHARFVLLGEPSPQAAQAPDAHKFSHPVTAPYYHEDSFVTTDVRLWYAYHKFPKDSVLGGGDANVVAAQLRLAITDQIQLVAYKDGYMDIESDLVDSGGWNDLAAGLKWNFIQDWNNQLHVAVGAGYEFPTGETDALQNDSEWRFWASVNKGFDRLHLGATANIIVGEHKNGSDLGNSDRFLWHLHADYRVCEWFSPILEFNGYHVIDEGKAFVPFDGVDVVNLGGGKGEDVVTVGVGVELRPLPGVAARAAWETPLTDNEDIFDYRWTFSVVLSF